MAVLVTHIVGEIVYEAEGVIERVKGWVVGMAVPEVVLQVVAERVIVTERVRDDVRENVETAVVGRGDNDLVLLNVIV